jgi:hypothetical protein
MALWAWLRQDGMGSGRLKVDPWPASGQGKGEALVRVSGPVATRFGSARRAELHGGDTGASAPVRWFAQERGCVCACGADGASETWKAQQRGGGDQR